MRREVQTWRILGGIGAAALLAAAVATLAARAWSAPREGDEMVGKPAPAWGPLVWIQGELRLPKDARGKVVLVRYWTDACALCERTAPALNELHDRYAAKGLLVLGVYHPKPPRAQEAEEIRKAARTLGFRFPVAADPDWSMLKRWWLDAGRRRFTSVSFLLDRQGVVRRVHPGGEFHTSRERGHEACDREYGAIEAEVRRLIAAGG